MDNKDQKDPKDPEQIDENLLDDALGGYDDEEKLNLTASVKEDNEEVDPELEKEYQDFLKSLNQEGGQGEDDMMKQFSSLMSGFMGGMKPEDLNGMAGPDAGGEQPGVAEAQLKNMLQGLMQNVDNENFDSVAQNFLREFMDKDILQEPLLEAKKNYETYLAENKAKLNETDLKNYTEQYNCIMQLLGVIENEPENKEKMINIFEKMHDYGMPPEGILNPLQQVQGLAGPGQAGGFPGGIPGMPGGFPGGMPGMPGGFPGGFPGMPGGFNPNGKPGEDCNIF